MSEINANFVVDPITLTVQQTDPGLTITPDVTNLNIYAGGYAQPQGNVGELQYNADGARLGGAANTVVSNGNVRFTNLSNLQINGGNNAYFLQTDGTGNLTWAQGTANVSGNGTAAGANTQIQISDGTGNFTSGAGFTFDTASNLFSTPGNAIIASNLTVNNIAVTSNISVNNVTVTNNVAANVVKTDNLLYANGTPWDLDNPGGSNTAIQYNDNESFGGSSAFTFDNVSNAVVLTGNITTNNANLGNLATANYFTGTLTTNAQPNITSVGTLSSLSVTGNISSGNANLGNNANANFFYGNGAFLTGIDTSRISNGNSNVRVYANSDVTISITGVANRVVFDQNAARYQNYPLTQTQGANSVFLDNGRISMDVANQTLGFILRTYNASTNETAEWDFFRARGNNGTPLPVTTNDIVSNIRNYVYADSGNQNYTTGTIRDIVDSNDGSGNVTSTTQIRKWGTSSDKIELYAPLVKITGNGSNNTLLYGNGQIFTVGEANAANVVARSYFVGDGTYISNIVGANVTGTVANANYAAYAGNVVTANQPNITSVGNLSSLTVVGNIDSNNINGGNLVTANYFTGTLTTANQPNITTVGNLTNLVVTGNITSGNIDGGNLVTANYFSGTLITANQPNITTLGNLTNLVVDGNISGNNLSITNYANANIINANNINATEYANANNINVTANLSAGNVKTDNLLYANGTPWDLEQPGGSNTNIQFNDNNDFGGSNAFTFDNTTNVMALSGTANVNGLILNNNNIVLGNGSFKDPITDEVVLIGRNARSANISVGNVLISAGALGIAIGYNANVVGSYSIALGANATASYPNSITLNATGSPLSSYGDGRFTVKPVSNAQASSDNPDALLFYNTTTGVICYQPSTNAGTVTFGIVGTTTYTVNTLPTANSVGVGARAFVTDATANTFNSIVSGGGATRVPVFSTGTQWRIG